MDAETTRLVEAARSRIGAMRIAPPSGEAASRAAADEMEAAIDALVNVAWPALRADPAVRGDAAELLERAELYLRAVPDRGAAGVHHVISDMCAHIVDLHTALRACFPHFQSNEPITVETIERIGKEYAEMTGWEPRLERIVFVDQDNVERKLEWVEGDERSGWCIPDHAPWGCYELPDRLGVDVLLPPATIVHRANTPKFLFDMIGRRRDSGDTDMLEYRIGYRVEGPHVAGVESERLASNFVGSLIMLKGNLNKYKVVVEQLIRELRAEPPVANDQGIVLPRPPAEYLVWSAEHQAWWGPASTSYSKGLHGAGRYTRDEALTICAKAVPTAGHLGHVAEIPVPSLDAQHFLMRAPVIPEAIFKGTRR